MKDEIIAGIRNALDRGYSIQQAVQSFINAGYNPNEVKEAAEAFSGASHIAFGNDEPKQVSAKLISFNQQPAQNTPVQNFPTPNNVNIPKEKSKGKGIVITLVIILVFLLAVLISSIVFRDQILEFVRNL